MLGSGLYIVKLDGKPLFLLLLCTCLLLLALFLFRRLVRANIFTVFFTFDLLLDTLSRFFGHRVLNRYSFRGRSIFRLFVRLRFRLWLCIWIYFRLFLLLLLLLSFHRSLLRALLAFHFSVMQELLD